jgi:hypothetical protein
MALVCTVPEAGRGERRTDVQSIIRRATSFRELEDGVAFEFAGSDEVSRLLFDLVLAERSCCAQFRYGIHFGPRQGAIELRVKADGQLVQPLKDLYLGLARVTDAQR